MDHQYGITITLKRSAFSKIVIVTTGNIAYMKILVYADAFAKRRSSKLVFGLNSICSSAFLTSITVIA